MAHSPRRDTTWLDLADELIDESVNREESITLTAEDMTVDVPLSFGEDAEQAQWHVDGEVTVTVEGMRGSIAEWMHLFREAQRDSGE
ncbi:hypothetical protein BRD06_07585 [Halobacteriales archaeon QS_9_67_15]|nr:MAG: hypothetical protein BRD06_07585 [Halobacteriales archaeon QS_9_67_15]